MRALFFAGALLFVSACTSLAPKPQFDISDPHLQTLWQQRVQQLQAVRSWNLHGRFGASAHDEAWSGSLSWLQQGDQYVIQLSGPLNQGAIELRGDGRHASLRLSSDKVYTDSDAEALLHRHTGIHFPVTGLRYWILGMPAPRVDHARASLDEAGYLTELEQYNWQIVFKRYADVRELRLPDKLFLTHDHIEVRLVLDQWELQG